MSKKIAAMTFIIIASLCCSSVFALPSFGKKDEGTKEPAKTVDVSQLEVSSLILIWDASWATISVLDASAQIYEAIGNKEEAAKLRVGIEKLTKNPEDKDSLKECVKEANKAIENINKKEDLKDSLNTAATFDVVGAFLDLGCAIYLDSKALEMAKLIADDSKTALDQTPKTKVSEIKRIKAALESAVFLSGNIPDQLKSITSVSANLIELAKTKKLDLPSQKDIDKKAEGMTKKG